MNTVAQGELLKAEVKDHWNQQSCGEGYAATEAGLDLAQQEKARYALEPYIFDFAKFGEGRDRDVLEIGVGMGADHHMWALAKPKSLTGVDLTPRAIEFTRERFAAEGLTSDLRVSDAEALPFQDETFDIVYSWGVMHHSPNTQQCFREAWRVLRPGGVARIMVYNTYSLIGLMLWLRYGLLAGRPLRPMDDIYHHHLESPGTKAYRPEVARQMMTAAGFSDVTCRIQLSHADLLEGQVGVRHEAGLVRAAKALWPRGLLKRVAAGHGLFLLIEARK